jgi:NADH-quinone oxidoreductase subunit M
MAGTFFRRSFILHLLGIINSFISLLYWGNGDVEERKKAVVKFFIYTLGSLFMLIALFIYTNKQEVFIRRFI